MAEIVKPKAKQVIRAKTTDATVFADYKGSGLSQVAFAANKVGDSMGEATGNTFPGTGVSFIWYETSYLVQTSYVVGFPSFERKIGYVPSSDVYLEDAATTPTTPATGQTPSTRATPTNIPSKGQTVTGNEKVVQQKKILPTWAIYALAGLGVATIILISYVAIRQKKTVRK